MLATDRAIPDGTAQCALVSAQLASQLSELHHASSIEPRMTVTDGRLAYAAMVTLKVRGS